MTEGKLLTKIQLNLFSKHIWQKQEQILTGTNTLGKVPFPGMPL